MSTINRFKNRLIAKVITRYPSLAQRFITAYEPWESGEAVPWAPPHKPLGECKLALVTTSGVHHSSQEPFDMQDSDGDPSFRAIDGATIGNDYQITHDYYYHSDAEKDEAAILEQAKRHAGVGNVGKFKIRGDGFDGKNCRVQSHRSLNP